MSLWDKGRKGVLGRRVEHPDDLPCLSNTVNASIDMGAGGAIVGLIFGSNEARQLGLTGINRAGFVANFAAKCSFLCAMVTGVAAAAHCGVRKYRGKDDWVNCLVSGAMAGGTGAALTRSWKKFIPATCLISAFYIYTDSIIKELEMEEQKPKEHRPKANENKPVMNE